jgi:hypothetical protein
MARIQEVFIVQHAEREAMNLQLRYFTAPAVLLGVLAALSGCGGDSGSPPNILSVISPLPNVVSGGTALVRVDASAAPSVTLNNKDVSASFKADPYKTNSYLGVVTGLVQGDNTLVASAGFLTNTVVVKNYPKTGPIISGPWIKPFKCTTHEYNYLPDSNANLTNTELSGSNGCDIGAPQINYVYLTTGNTYKTLPNANILSSTYPADISTTTIPATSGGAEKFIALLETGTINRSIYQLAVPYDPIKYGAGSGVTSSTTSYPNPLSPTKVAPGWNRKLIYGFGGGCQQGYYTQGNDTNLSVLRSNLPGASFPQLYLSQGFASASSTLNTQGNNCNDVLSAETAAMTKEQFVKSYGVPIYTMGAGSSGGSTQQISIGENYPGVLDGITSLLTFADFGSQFQALMDSRLIDIYVNVNNPKNNASAATPVTWTKAQINAVTGMFNTDLWQVLSDRPGGLNSYLYGQTITNQVIDPVYAYPGMPVTSTSANRLDPAQTSPIYCNKKTYNVLTGCVAVNAQVSSNTPTVAVSPPPGAPIYPKPTKPDALAQFDAALNPIGVRTNMIDANVNILGKRASDGYAQRYLDNVGVQYGLNALLSGQISADQFIDLNQNIGGVDINFQYQKQRTVADAGALARVYSTGRAGRGSGGLSSMPIITRIGYNDITTNVSTASGRSGTVTHAKYWTFSLRERLLKANGAADNQVIHASMNSPNGTFATDTIIGAMDKWLSAMASDTKSYNTAYQKVVANKPADVTDACWDSNLNKIVEKVSLFTGQCAQFATFGITYTPSVNGGNPTVTGTSFSGGQGYQNPLMAAGGPLTADILKCQLKPINAADYVDSSGKQLLSAAQLTQLQSIFSTGVCDWSKPGVGQVASSVINASFGPHPVNLVFDITTATPGQ